MDAKTFLASMRLLLEQLLNGNIPGGEFVEQYNDLMADEIPDDLPQEVYAPLDQYHTEFNLYVEDPIMRKDRPDDYYGLEVLRNKARNLLCQIGCDQEPRLSSQ
jgi:hypothetical protein